MADSSRIDLSWELSRTAESTPDGLRLILMAHLEATIDSTEKRAPLNISLVLDRSGSMAGDKLAQCIHAARFGASQLATEDRASVVIFDHNVDVLVPHGPVQKSHVMESLHRIVTGGNTNLSGGWLEGAASVQKFAEPGHVSRVLLLTDGQANAGITDQSQLNRLAQDLLHKGVQTTTIGFGSGFNEDLLRSMADAGGGNFHFIANSDEAATVFAREFKELLQVAAQNVRLRVLPARGVNFVRTLQHYPAKEIFGGVEVNVGDLIAGDEKYVLVELFIPRNEIGRKGVSVMELSFQQVV